MVDANDEVIFDVEGAAKFACVSPGTIRRWFAEGLRHMPTVSRVARTGPRREIVRKSVLIAFIEAREVGAALSPEVKAGCPPSKYAVGVDDDPHGLMRKRIKC